MWTTSDQELIRPLTASFREAPQGLAFAGLGANMLLRMMDEVDHAMLVIDAYCQLRHANHLGRHALANSRFVACHGQMLMGSRTAYTQQIDMALKNALKGHRQLITLKEGENELVLAFIPLSHALETESPCVLVMLSRQNACENLAVRMYARAHHLSPSEESVLVALCKGYAIPEIAKENGVALSTVRTQIKALRAKTGCPSIRMILLRVNSLPPVMSALRSVTPKVHNAMDLV